jgi:hypothetical protein
MSSAGFRSTYLSAYNQFLYFIQIYQFISNPRIAYLAIVCALHEHRSAHYCKLFKNSEITNKN